MIVADKLLPQKWCMSLVVRVNFENFVGPKTVSHKEDEPSRGRFQLVSVWGHAMDERRCKVNVENGVEENQMNDETSYHQNPIHCRFTK